MISTLKPVDHAPRIVAIQQSAYAIEAELMGFAGIPPLHETEEDVAAMGHLRWLGAFEASTLVGVLAWEQQAEVLEIDRLAVDPAFSRQGYGRQLVQAVPAAPLTTVSTGTANYPALNLYASLGFRETGRIEVAEGIFTTQLERQSRL